MTLEQQERLIKELLERGKPLGVTGVKLEHGGAGIFATLCIQASYRHSWPDVAMLWGLTGSVARDLSEGDDKKKSPLYFGQWYCDRELSLFSTGSRAEVYTDWHAIPSWREDEICRDAEAAQCLIQLEPDVVQGWCPGVVDRAEGNTVYVNLARLPWFDGHAATQQTIPVGYQSPRLRLA